jgi:hypothetical protein
MQAQVFVGASGYGQVGKRLNDLLQTSKYEEAIDIVLNGGSQPEVIDLLVEGAKTRITALVKGSGSVRKNFVEATEMMFIIRSRFPQTANEMMNHFVDEVVDAR